MFRAYGTFDKLLEKATSSLRLDPDWPSILQICDLIRQNDCPARYAVSAIKKKLSSPNPHQAMFALQVLESIVKNCGSGVHDEIASVTNCEAFRAFVKSQTHDNVRTKMLELMQAWAYAFRNILKYRPIQDAVNILKAEGYKFPVLKESDAMFSADSAPQWSDGDVCHRCRVPFSLMQRKHHCRACGQVFCQQCSAKTATLPKFGIEKEVRVCDACLEQVNKPNTTTVSTKSDSSDTFGNSLPQDNQPKSKTAEELREEEDIQLALALSQSEAEHKEKEKQRSTPSHIPNTNVQHQLHGSPPSSAPPAELSRYLDRSYWEQRVQPSSLQLEPPSAPTPSPGPTPSTIAINLSEIIGHKNNTAKLENGASGEPEMEEFVTTLKSQVEIFVNRMKSNSSRGRAIANDSSVQTLFMNITAMHSRLLRYIQQQDDNRVYYEGLQDKLTQVKDSRAALDVLREEHAERMRQAAEQAELQRQMQMAHKLDIMRKKKHEYLQYQRQLALQRIQEQEREMQMRQEQQKHQYMLGGTGGYFLPGSQVPPYHGTQSQPPIAQSHPSMIGPMHQQQKMIPDNSTMLRQPTPQNVQGGQISQPNMPIPPPPHMPHIPSMNMQIPGMAQPHQLGMQIPPINQLPPGLNPSESLRQPGPPITQISHINNQQHQTLTQGGQLPHQQQINKQPQAQVPQIGLQGTSTLSQGQQHIPSHIPSQMTMQGGQPLPQHQHINTQGSQANQQIAPMQQLSSHGQIMSSHQVEPNTPVNQSVNSQINTPPSQVVGQPMYDPQYRQMFQVLSQQGQHIPHLQQQMNEAMRTQSQNITPTNSSNQTPNRIPNQGSTATQILEQIIAHMNQGRMNINNSNETNELKIDTTNQLRTMSPPNVQQNTNSNQQSTPIISPPPINVIDISPQKAPSIEETTTTAELISFD